MIPFSILDLSPIVEGGDAAQALRNTLDLARHAEAWGYQRYWLAEHHNMPGDRERGDGGRDRRTSPAARRRIRVGAGGIMLPNHAPLVIAEQFGTLESLFPGRIDLGLGRAPGIRPTHGARAAADAVGDADTFPQDVLELMGYFARAAAASACGRCPAPGSTCRSGSSVRACSARSSRRRSGLPYAFASHFAPAHMLQAIALYRQPIPAVATARSPLRDARRQRLRRRHRRGGAASVHVARSRRSSTCAAARPAALPPPDDRFTGTLAPHERVEIDHTLSVTSIGSTETVHAGIAAFVARTGADELIMVSQIYDHAARLRSYELTAALRERVEVRTGNGPRQG